MGKRPEQRGQWCGLVWDLVWRLRSLGILNLLVQPGEGHACGSPWLELVESGVFVDVGEVGVWFDGGWSGVFEIVGEVSWFDGVCDGCSRRGVENVGG